MRFVAEVSSNHQTDLGRALRFVDRAADVGCDAVKFQLFRIDELFAPEILRRSESHRARRRWELPLEFIAPLSRRCRGRGLAFGCTPFYLGAVEALAEHVDFFKIASYELLWDALLERCAETGVPLVLSTGMATLEEIRHACDAFEKAGGRELTLLHCVSGYPAPPDQAHLGAIDALQSLGAEHPRLRLAVGWSDHTVSPGVIHRAVHAHRSSMVEFHLDLDGDGDEFEAGHCWLPDAIERTIRDVRTGLRAEGRRVKAPSPIESQERVWRADPSDGLRPLKPIRDAWRPTP